VTPGRVFPALWGVSPDFGVEGTSTLKTLCWRAYSDLELQAELRRLFLELQGHEGKIRKELNVPVVNLEPLDADAQHARERELLDQDRNTLRQSTHISGQ
jgi:hypothetical protein